MGPVESTVVEKLKKAFSPSHLEVINESGSHNVPAGSESHFKVIIAAKFFEQKSKNFLKFAFIKKLLVFLCLLPIG